MRGWFFWVVIAGVFATVGHLSYVLFGPEYWMEKKLNALLSDQGGVGFITLTPQKSLQLLPAEDPSLVLKICRFELTNGPVRIGVAPSQQFWSLSIYSQKGDSYYTINDRQLRNSNLQIILTSKPAEGEEEPGPRKSEKNKVFINAPSPNGWAIIRLALPDASLRDATIEKSKVFSCIAATKSD